MPGNPLTDPNWADETTDTVVRIVGKVRDSTTTKVVYAARAVVFGIIAIFLGLFAVVILLIFATRTLQALLDLLVERERAVYVSYLAVGGILTLVGAFFFKKRNSNT